MTFIVEVMGRSSGDLAQAVGIASGARFILTPETLNDFPALVSTLRSKGHDIIVVAEGDESGGAFQLAEAIKNYQEASGDIPCNFRVCVLGHVQRGGSPSARDRILAHKMGLKAIEALLQGQSLVAVAEQNNNIVITKL